MGRAWFFVGCVLLVIVVPARGDGRGHECRSAAAIAVLADGKPFDPQTGRETRSFPPDPQVRFKHLKLDLTFDDFQSKSFKATETLTFETAGRPIQKLELDAVNLRIKSVRAQSQIEGPELPYRYDGEKLTVRFPRELAPGASEGLIIDYECVDPALGMIFALPDDAHRDRALTVHTQGESIENRHWFIAHDWPNVRLTSEIIVTMPAGNVAISNGRLVSREEISPKQVRYHYLQDKPHVPYLVSLVMGEFATVTDEWRGIPVEYHVPPTRAADARPTFGKTPRMMELFSRLTGFDYPWAKYSQACVYNFAWGGMENTSATTLIDTAVLDARARLDRDEEGLISHELAHQWFGDLVTCTSWPHIWLNEGFATYLSHVWSEHEYGRDEYDFDVWMNARGVADSDRLDLRGGVVFPFYDKPMDVFSRGSSNPYGKGAAAIHQLRMSLGDELFWQCIREYLHRFAYKTAETDDLRKVIDDVSGRSYERFFHQWLYRPGVPTVKVDYAWDESAGGVKLSFTQIQEIKAEQPAFTLDIELRAVFDGGSSRDAVVHMESRARDYVLACDREPRILAVDPRATLLARVELNLPVGMLVTQAREGPTMAARLYALRAIVHHDRDDVRETLGTILTDEKAHGGLRGEAARLLGQHQQDAARDMLIVALAEDTPIRDPRVRRAAIDALGQYRGEEVVPTLLRFARRDETYGVETSATRALGGQETSDEIVAVLLENTRKASHGEEIRTAAVAALVQLADVRGIGPALRLARLGERDRARPTGIDALGKLGRELRRRLPTGGDSSVDTKLIPQNGAGDAPASAAGDASVAADVLPTSWATYERVRRTLVDLLADPEQRAVGAAIDALRELGDDTTIGPLQRYADGSAPAELRRQARDAISAIRSSQGESAALKDLRERIQSLEKARERYEKSLPAGRDD
ncbi:MAG: M1 family aminopeptidase [Phycisphaerae bacterium]